MTTKLKNLIESTEFLNCMCKYNVVVQQCGKYNNFDACQILIKLTSIQSSQSLREKLPFFCAPRYKIMMFKLRRRVIKGKPCDNYWKKHAYDDIIVVT